MRPLPTLLLLLACAIVLAATIGAQGDRPVATLVPPTLVPVDATRATVDALPGESALAQIIAGNTFKVGVLYNAPPYSELTLQGELRGFDIELLRLISAAWGADIEFTQVTRQNARQSLLQGDVHAVISALAPYRDAPDDIEFTQAYQISRHALLVRPNSDISQPPDLLNRTVAYVLGTRSEKALTLWRDRVGVTLDATPHLNLDRAFAGLVAGEVDAVVGEAQELLQITGDYGDLVRMLDQPILREPRALAVRRFDAPMRQLLNRTIQMLASEGKLQLLSREYFPDEAFPDDAIAIWDGADVELSLAQTPSQIDYARQYALPRLLSSRALRAGGLDGAPPLESAGGGRLAALNRALVDEMASRWGVRLEIVPSSPLQATELLRAGAVDLVVGVKPAWQLAPQMDFSAPYLLHGDRLMAPTRRNIDGFNDLRGRIIGIIIGDDGAQERAQAWADSINASVRFFRTTESGAAQTLLDFNNANAIYADSLALIPHLEANADQLELTPRWYSRGYYALALPPNDPDFRRLVDYTLGEMIADGALFALTTPLLLTDELPGFVNAPGPAEYKSISLARA